MQGVRGRRRQRDGGIKDDGKTERAGDLISTQVSQRDEEMKKDKRRRRTKEGAREIKEKELDMRARRLLERMPE